ncbi:MAG: HAD family hydrolase [Clostridiales bacterium]|nr:HAD family hydrolase [Clostridiales bacterium]
MQAVVFDLDGTLLDTLVDLCEAVNFALRSCSQPEVSLNQVRQNVGNGIKNLVSHSLPDGEDNPCFDEVFSTFREYYDRHCLDHTVPYEGIVPLVRELNAQGMKMAIVSNKVDSAVKELAEKFFPDEIKVAVGEREGIKRKPAPDTVNQALAELGVSASQAVYVGDSDVDLLTAQNAGLPCVSVTWGFRDEKFLRRHGAKIRIAQPLELLHKI